MIISSAFCDLPQASMTKASLTAVQTMASTPVAFILSEFTTKPGRWVAVQPGVKAPGTPKSIEGYAPHPNCATGNRSEEHTSELQSRPHLVCRLLLEKKNNKV